MTPKLIIFDCDGVLVDSEPATEQLLAKNLTEHGLPITPDQVHHLFVGGTMRGVYDTARKKGAVLPETWVDDFYAELFIALAKGVPVFSGIMELLDQLDAAGIASAVASNGPMAKMDITLKPSGLWDRLAGRIYSGHNYKPKPHPDMLLHACKTAGVSPAEAVMIDDTPTGCLAAKAAGVPCLGFLPTGDPTALEATGARVVRSHADVSALLGLG